MEEANSNPRTHRMPGKCVMYVMLVVHDLTNTNENCISHWYEGYEHGQWRRQLGGHAQVDQPVVPKFEDVQCSRPHCCSRICCMPRWEARKQVNVGIHAWGDLVCPLRGYQRVVPLAIRVESG